MHAENHEMIVSMRSLIARAIKVYNALPQTGLRRYRTPWPITSGSEGAYGYNATEVRFLPTARDISRMEIIMDWLGWLRQSAGDRTMWLVWSYCCDVPTWRLAQREECTERTVHNRAKRAIASIIANFGGPSIVLPVLNEKPAEPITSLVLEKSLPGHSGTIGQHGKVWIDGTGFMKGGKPLRNGTERVDERRLRTA